jgi:hypothetical protein
MVRPIDLDNTVLEGTVTDGMICLCASTTDLPWGMLIFVGDGNWDAISIDGTLPVCEQMLSCQEQREWHLGGLSITS